MDTVVESVPAAVGFVPPAVTVTAALAAIVELPMWITNWLLVELPVDLDTDTLDIDSVVDPEVNV